MCCPKHRTYPGREHGRKTPRARERAIVQQRTLIPTDRADRYRPILKDEILALLNESPWLFRGPDINRVADNLVVFGQLQGSRPAVKRSLAKLMAGNLVRNETPGVSVSLVFDL